MVVGAVSVLDSNCAVFCGGNFSDSDKRIGRRRDRTHTVLVGQCAAVKHPGVALKRKNRRMEKVEREVTIKQDKDAPVPIEVLAEAIVAISQGLRRLRKSSLNDKALILLITRACPAFGSSRNRQRVSAKQVRAVMDGIQILERTYMRRT